MKASSGVHPQSLLQGSPRAICVVHRSCGKLSKPCSLPSLSLAGVEVEVDVVVMGVEVEMEVEVVVGMAVEMLVVEEVVEVVEAVEAEEVGGDVSGGGSGGGDGEGRMVVGEQEINSSGLSSPGDWIKMRITPWYRL